MALIPRCLHQSSYDDYNWQNDGFKNEEIKKYSVYLSEIFCTFDYRTLSNFKNNTKWVYLLTALRVLQ